MAAIDQALTRRPNRSFTARLRGIRNLPLFPLTILSLVVLGAILAPYISPHDPYTQSLADRLQPPFWENGGNTNNLLGTDHLGRDLLTRLIFGSRVAVIVAGLAITASATVGTMIGMMAGFFSGKLDSFVMRVVDVQLALPALLFGVFLSALMGAGLTNVILIIALWSWASYARVVRGETLSLRERDFITAARVIGAPWWRIIRVHLFPNVFNSVLVLATLDVGTVIIFEASLSFLGLGVVPPTPAWGSMVADGRNFLSVAWWVITIPGLAVFAVCLSGNLLGDWLRDRLDPRLRHTRK